MTSSLLKTKLHIPPIRSELVSRPRLIEGLDTGLDRKLTLVSAPAGFGKTTLLSEWVTRHRDRTAWLSPDREDNDQVRFWTYLVAALQTVHADLGQDALQPGLGGHPRLGEQPGRAAQRLRAGPARLRENGINRCARTHLLV